VAEKIFILEDLRSLNGTYVNKKRVHKWLLKPNDVITIGQHALEYLEEDSPPPAPPPTAYPESNRPEPWLEGQADGKIIPLSKETTYFGNNSRASIARVRCG
jgi:hypothetical protein